MSSVIEKIVEFKSNDKTNPIVEPELQINMETDEIRSNSIEREKYEEHNVVQHQQMDVDEFKKSIDDIIHELPSMDIEQSQINLSQKMTDDNQYVTPQLLRPIEHKSQLKNSTDAQQSQNDDIQTNIRSKQNKQKKIKHNRLKKALKIDTIKSLSVDEIKNNTTIYGQFQRCLYDERIVILNSIRLRQLNKSLIPLEIRKNNNFTETILNKQIIRHMITRKVDSDHLLFEICAADTKSNNNMQNDLIDDKIRCEPNIDTTEHIQSPIQKQTNNFETIENDFIINIEMQSESVMQSNDLLENSTAIQIEDNFHLEKNQIENEIIVDDNDKIEVINIHDTTVQRQVFDEVFVDEQYLSLFLKKLNMKDDTHDTHDDTGSESSIK